MFSLFPLLVQRMKLSNTLYKLVMKNFIVILKRLLIKELGWGPQQLVDWLLCSDEHFILSHVHQGMSALGESQMGWNMLLLQKQLMRLRDHRGYPNGDKLHCVLYSCKIN